MAIFHLSVKTISRSSGRSATAAIAYRAGEKITDDRTGLVHDYTRRKGIEHTEIFLPQNAPTWAANREQLWNAAELAENRKNSTVAREFELALPAELSQGQRLALVRDFAGELVNRHGMAVDVAIHTPGAEGDNRNHHAHVLCTTRRLTPEGFKDKTRELDDQKSGEVVHWRERWAELANQHLERAGHIERIDHRSLEAQRVAAQERGDTEQAAALERSPTVHLGPNVVQMEQRGVRTGKGDKARQIGTFNAQIIDLAKVRQQLRETMAKAGEKAVAIVSKALTGKELSPELIKRQWHDEKDRQFKAIAQRAKGIQARVAGHIERQDKKINQHNHVRPDEPTGIFAGFKRAAYEQASAAWTGTRRALDRRLTQLRGRFSLMDEYSKEKGPHQIHHKGESLAITKARTQNPELAEKYDQVRVQESEAKKAEMRAKMANKGQAMTQENGTTNQSDQQSAELKKLDKDMERVSRAASMQNEQEDKPDRELSAEEKRQKMVERYMDKLARDRDLSRGRGR